MGEPPPLHLVSDGLLSRWGFYDGDQPETLLDWADDQPDPDLRDLIYDADWRAVLRRLVRDHLLPRLAERHAIEVYDVETNHNPIRASRVDGKDIDATADNDDIRLEPEAVEVSGWDVLAAVRAVSTDRIAR